MNGSGIMKDCREVGVSYNTLYVYAKRHNIGLAEALKHYAETGVEKREKPAAERPFVFKGVEYRKLKDACDALGIPYKNAMYMKRRKYRSDEEIKYDKIQVG